MNIKKFLVGLSIVVLVVVFSFVIFFFTTTSIKNGEDTNETKKDFKVGLIAVETKDSNLLVNNVYSALDETKDQFGGSFDFKEGVAVSDLDGNIGSGDYSLVYLVGKEYKDVVAGIAEKYPDVDFVLINSKVSSSLSNLINLELNYRGSGFVKGVLAGELTNNSIVATVGLKEEAVVLDEMYGFEKGVENVSRDIAVYGSYVATSGGGATASSLISQYISYGADVVFPMALDSNGDVLQVLKDNGIEGIVNDDTYVTEFGDVIVASIYIDAKAELLAITQKAEKGELDGGNIIAPVIVSFVKDVDADIATKVKDIIVKINSGQYDMDSIVPME